ncbi:MAG: aspartate aminotransferase family protein [Bacillota bacterium]|nr:aspartate aminotransferase family protein [Bacillota bacterium]HHU62285.1 aspartate aminotransferase family protein [Natronincola sp.]
MTNEQVVALADKYILHTYGRLPIAPVKGEGCYLWDADGNRYLDFIGGIAVTSQGHCHPKVVDAIKKQAEKLLHCSNLFQIPNQALLAEKLCVAGGLKKAFFCNSGAEANEGAIKLARKWGKENKNGAFEIIVAKDSFHGRTIGALSATAQRKYQEAFEPLVPGFKVVPYGDLEALKNSVSAQTVAIMLEPLQGEGGVHPAPQGYLEGIAKLVLDENLLFILDEVQTGIGRTGKMFAFQHYGIKPDIVTLAKALGSGFPIGAMLTGERASNTFVPGDHASTFGGNPLATAAALASVEVIEDGLIDNCTNVGNYFKEQLENFAQKWPVIKNVRGLGLLLGVELAVPAGEYVAAAREKGLLILTAGEKVLRFLPPLTISKDDVDTCLRILEEVFESLQS